MAQAQAQLDQGKWDDLLAKAGSDMCSALGMGTQVMVARHQELPAGCFGACIPLVGALQIQLVLLSTNSGVRALAERLVSLDETDDPLTRDDVQDAFAELANQFAGLAKRGLSRCGELRLGLPVFVRGTLKPPRGVPVYAHEVQWGETRLTLGIVTSDELAR